LQVEDSESGDERSSCQDPQGEKTGEEDEALELVKLKVASQPIAGLAMADAGQQAAAAVAVDRRGDQAKKQAAAEFGIMQVWAHGILRISDCGFQIVDC